MIRAKKAKGFKEFVGKVVNSVKSAVDGAKRTKILSRVADVVEDLGIPGISAAAKKIKPELIKRGFKGGRSKLLVKGRRGGNRNLMMGKLPK